MSDQRVVTRPEYVVGGITLHHICASGLTAANRIQFIRRQWWIERTGRAPEEHSANFVPEEFRNFFLRDPTQVYVYHPRWWEQAIILGDSQIVVDRLRSYDLSHLTQAQKEIDRSVYEQIPAILLQDCELCGVYQLRELLQDPDFFLCDP